MCELFGISSARKVDCSDLLNTFFSHAAEHPADWEPAPLNTLLAFRYGKLAFNGKNHGNEYIKMEAGEIPQPAQGAGGN